RGGCRAGLDRPLSSPGAPGAGRTPTPGRPVLVANANAPGGPPFDRRSGRGVSAPEGRRSIAKGASPWTAREPPKSSLEPRRGDGRCWRDEITVAPPGLKLDSLPHSCIPGADAPGY